MHNLQPKSYCKVRGTIQYVFKTNIWTALVYLEDFTPSKLTVRLTHFVRCPSALHLYDRSIRSGFPGCLEWVDFDFSVIWVSAETECTKPWWLDTPEVHSTHFGHSSSSGSRCSRCNFNLRDTIATKTTSTNAKYRQRISNLRPQIACVLDSLVANWSLGREQGGTVPLWSKSPCDWHKEKDWPKTAAHRDDIAGPPKRAVVYVV